MTCGTKSTRLLRMLVYLMGNHPQTMENCTRFLGIKKSAFYKYINELKDVGFDVRNKAGGYSIEAPEKSSPLLASLLHFSEEEAFVLSKAIDTIEGNTQAALRLKHKLVAFLNRDEAVEAYLKKEKKEVVQILNKSICDKKQVLLEDYASGHSLTVTDRRVEPFEFNDDFNLIYAYDVSRKENLQFKICRIGNVHETPLGWKYAQKHRSLPVDVFRNSGSLDREVHLEINLRAYNLLTEEYPLAEKYIQKKNDGLYELKVPVAIYEGPGRFVLGMAEDVTVKGDEGFRAYLKEKINRYTKIF